MKKKVLSYWKKIGNQLVVITMTIVIWLRFLNYFSEVDFFPILSVSHYIRV